MMLSDHGCSGSYYYDFVYFSCGCVLIITVGLLCMQKLKSSNRRAITDAVSNIEMREPSPTHVYEAIIAPKTVINQEGESKDKNVAYTLQKQKC